MLLALATAAVGVLVPVRPAAAADPAFTILPVVAATACTTTAPGANCRTTIVITGINLPVVDPSKIGVSSDRADTIVTVNDTTANWWAGRDSSFRSHCGVVIGLSSSTTLVFKVGAYGARCLATFDNFVHGGDVLVVKLYNGDAEFGTVTAKAAAPSAAIPTVNDVNPPFGPIVGGTTADPTTGRAVMSTSGVTGAPQAVWFGDVATTDIQEVGGQPGQFSVLPPPSPIVQGDVAVGVQVVDGTFGASQEGCAVFVAGCPNEYFYMNPSTNKTAFTDPLNFEWSKSLSAGTAVGSNACGASIPAGLSASLTVGGAVNGGPLNVTSNFGFSYSPLLKVPAALVASAELKVDTPVVIKVSLAGQLSGCQAIPIPALTIPEIAGFYIVVGGSITAEASLTITIRQGTYTLFGGRVPGTNPDNFFGVKMVTDCLDEVGNKTTTCVTTQLAASLKGTIVVAPLWLQIGPKIANVGAGLAGGATGELSLATDGTVPPTITTKFDICVAGRWAAHFPVIGDLDGNWLGPVNVLGDGTICPFGPTTFGTPSPPPIPPVDPPAPPVTPPVPPVPPVDPPAPPVPPVTPDAGRYVAIDSPARLLDTRVGPTADGNTGRPGAGSVLELQVAGRAGVPNDAVAVVLNVIAIEPNAAGFITVFACGEPTPVASNLNYVANQVVSNSVVARVGSGGKVCIYTQATSHLVVDVDGYFMPGSIQLLPVPRRVVDTRRSPDLLVQLPSRQVAGSVLEVMIAGTPGVPTGARSVAINVTATDGTESGFLTVYPCDQARPNTSNVTYRAGQSVANSVISRLGATGALCVYVTGATFVIIDVAAVIPETTMTTAAAPIRVLDTRSSAVGILAAGSTTELQITGLPGAPATGGAAVLTFTAIDPVGSGYLTVFPCGQSVPAASNMNVVQGITVSTTAVAKIGAGGKVCIFTISATHVAVDLTGSFV